MQQIFHLTCPVLTALALLLPAASALALSDSDAQTFYSSSSEYRKAYDAMNAAWDAVKQKGTPAQMAALRDSQRYWLGKVRDSAVGNIMAQHLDPAQKYALVTKVRVFKMETFAQQAANGSKPVTVSGTVSRMNDLDGDGWGICSPISVKGASQSSCLYVAHLSDLSADSPLRATLETAANDGRKIEIRGRLLSPDGFDPASVSIPDQSAKADAAGQSEGAGDGVQSGEAAPARAVPGKTAREAGK